MKYKKMIVRFMRLVFKWCMRKIALAKYEHWIIKVLTPAVAIYGCKVVKYDEELRTRYRIKNKDNSDAFIITDNLDGFKGFHIRGHDGDDYFYFHTYEEGLAKIITQLKV